MTTPASERGKQHTVQIIRVKVRCPADGSEFEATPEGYTVQCGCGQTINLGVLEEEPWRARGTSQVGDER